MLVVGLAGASGTGKSYQALSLANEYNIDALIDDGLLIQNGRIVAGTSAKQQATKIGAIKTALFMDRSHAIEIKKAIQELQPAKILILGTSRAMVKKIAARLDLPPVSEIIDITRISSPGDIRKARQSRRHYGQHVVPAPTVEVKPRLPGLLIDPLHTWLKQRSPGHRQQPIMVEQTIVRPTFSMLGRFYISDEVLAEIAGIAVRLEAPNCRSIKTLSNKEPGGIHLEVHLAVPYGINILETAKRIQSRIVRDVEKMTNLNMLCLDIVVRKLLLSTSKKQLEIL